MAEKKKDITRAIIMDAACQVFAKESYNAASRESFIKNFRPTATMDEIYRYSYCFDAQAFMLLGASSY